MYRNKGGLKIDTKFYFDYADKTDETYLPGINVVDNSLQRSEKCFFFSDESNYNISLESGYKNTFIHFDENTKKQTKHTIVNMFYIKEKNSECYILQTKEHAQFIKVILEFCPFSFKFYDIWQHRADDIIVFQDMSRISSVVKHLYQNYFQKKNKTDWLLYCLERRNVSAPWLF